MKSSAGWICAACLCAAAALAQAPVTLTIDTKAFGPAIPDDFTGMSFGMRELAPSRRHFFSPTNTQLITLFQNLGLTHLRVGGTSVEWPATTPIADDASIDDLFAFARAAGVKKVIYSLRLLETNAALNYAATDAVIARYVWDHYQSDLQCFAIGNEPDAGAFRDHDISGKDFPSYLKRWNDFASVIARAVPEAKFAGPDGAGHASWPVHFAAQEKDSGLVTLITLHYYPGGKGRGVTADAGIKAMLTPARLKAYQSLYDTIAKPIMADGLPFCFTEANDHYSGGITNASDTLAGALWALDFLHWWAAHDARCVDFHNTMWVVNDTITHDEDGRLGVTPKGCAFKAFNLGGHGRVTPLDISNRDKINLTAYAVRNGKNLFVTIINKEYGAGAHTADVIIAAPETSGRAEAVWLTAPSGGDVTSKEGVTLGGGTIDSAGPWTGKWSPLPLAKEGKRDLNVPAATAVVVKMEIQ